VIAMIGKQVLVALPGGEERTLQVRTRVVVGDVVAVQGERVAAVEPRRTELERTGESGTRTLCANATLAVAVSSAGDPPFRAALLDRMLVAAAAAGMEAAIVLNKCDLGMDDGVLETLARYEAIGYSVFLVSASQGKGVEALADRMRGHTSAMIGHSGVGKSTLAMALAPGLALDVGRLDAWGRGRHTTIGGRMIALPGGGRMIDLPGVREFGVGHVGRAELRGCFPELAGVRCRYRDCMHDGEEGCVAEEATWEERIESYRKLLGECL
jgi:ribosome biogenesis GTPase